MGLDKYRIGRDDRFEPSPNVQNINAQSFQEGVRKSVEAWVKFCRRFGEIAKIARKVMYMRESILYESRRIRKARLKDDETRVASFDE